jgi:signal transduction histidine kinase
MRVRQILINLLGNACKFTENGEITLKVEHQHSKGNTLMMFTVSDTGTGISEDLIDRLFDPFTQGDDSTTKNHSGTGLGLSICYRLCILLGGEITVRSTEGQGTTFVVMLPLSIESVSSDSEEIFSDEVFSTIINKSA